MTDARRVASALLACLAGLLLVSCGDEEARVAEAASGISIEGQQSYLQLPHGRLNFQVTDAETLDDGDAPEADTSDGRFVGVDWTWVPGEGVPALLSGFLIAADVPADVRVQVDGPWHDLGPAYDTSEGGTASSAFFVPADDDVVASDVTIAVDFDGVTQTVRGDGTERETGDAAGIYDLAWDPTTVPCPVTFNPPTATGDPTCEAAFIELPYVSELGWAGVGSSWLVADLRVALPSFLLDQQDQVVLDQTESITLNGEDPDTVVLDESGSGGVLRTQSVFRSETNAALRVDFTRRLEYATTSPGQASVELTGGFDIPAR